MSLFRYSGNKTRLLPELPPPPRGVKTIIEPFAGSAAYGVHYRPQRLVLFDANSDVRELWRALSDGRATKGKLRRLESLRSEEKVDVRDLDLPRWQETLLRLTAASLVVGQLSSWTLYPQHSVDFSAIRKRLVWLQGHVSIAGRDFREAARFDGMPDTVFFVDPPYLGTQGNYIDKSRGADRTQGITRDDIAEFCYQLRSPTIFTYGDDAVETFPEFNWHVIAERKVANFRRGGSTTRREHAAFLNWPEE